MVEERPRTGMSVLQFVTEHAESINRGGLATQDEGTQRDGLETGRPGDAKFGGSEVALGADQPNDAARRPAEGGRGCGEDSLE
jgi:hypothetical protein